MQVGFVVVVAIGSSCDDQNCVGRQRVFCKVVRRVDRSGISVLCSDSSQCTTVYFYRPLVRASISKYESGQVTGKGSIFLRVSFENGE